jgi:hypothetical protein
MAYEKVGYKVIQYAVAAVIVLVVLGVIIGLVV